MRRKTFDALLTTVGLIVAAMLLVAGGLLTWAHSFVQDEVHSQLSAQKIFFPPAGSDALKDPAIKPYLSQYAGQQMTDGDQAKAYADHYILVHMNEASGGQTYSEVSGQYIAMSQDPKADPKKLAELGQLRETLFMGNTLRGLLLNAYAFDTMGEIAGYAAIASFAGAGVLLVLVGLGAVHMRRTSPEVEIGAPHQRGTVGAAI